MFPYPLLLCVLKSHVCFRYMFVWTWSWLSDLISNSCLWWRSIRKNYFPESFHCLFASPLCCWIRFYTWHKGLFWAVNQQAATKLLGKVTKLLAKVWKKNWELGDGEIKDKFIKRDNLWTRAVTVISRIRQKRLMIECLGQDTSISRALTTCSP